LAKRQTIGWQKQRKFTDAFWIVMLGAAVMYLFNAFVASLVSGFIMTLVAYFVMLVICWG
jgi:hypothetical protein